MSVVVVIVVIAAIAGMVYWNKRNAAAAEQGVSFVVPQPPEIVAQAITRGHNEGAMAMLRGVVGGFNVSQLGPLGFATSSRTGDSGEIVVSGDPAGSLVQARALSLYVGMPPRQLNTRSNGIWGLSVVLSHRIYTLLGITPGASKMKRWQSGLERRITKSLAKAGV